MARWIPQTYHINPRAQIILEPQFVTIGDCKSGPAVFLPESMDDAFAMAIALRQAAKHLEEIGKGL